MTTGRGGGVRFHVETLGCPKNAVDSDKVVASLLADGLTPAGTPSEADVVVVNTCAFVQAAREESIETVLALSGRRKAGARLVVTGCLAERYGDELAAALPEADLVVGFAGEGSIAARLGVGGGGQGPGSASAPEPAPVSVLGRKPAGVRDLLELPRPAPAEPWAYLKVAEGCDRTCAFCAIPSFRGKQRSRTPDAVVAEARSLVRRGAAELVLVAQDLASYGSDVGQRGALAPLLGRLDALAAEGLARLRLLYLYPSQVRDPLVSTMLELPTVVPYFDLSLQHASAPLLRRMSRPGGGERFLAIVEGIRRREPQAAFRSSFIFGFPGETEEDHEELLAFLEAAELDWGGMFPFSPEDGTRAATMDATVAPELALERLGEASELQERITRAARAALVGETVEVLVDAVDRRRASGRTHREAPEIDGVVHLATDRPGLRRGSVVRATVRSAEGPDLEATAWPTDARPPLDAPRPGDARSAACR